jgi:PHD/YefM family antitoxin component YafN of YafNO toxin-antitoxin module
MTVNRSIPIIEARNKLTVLPEQLGQEPETGAVAVTRRGKPVLALMSWKLCESLVETLEILGDESTMAALRQSVREVAGGKGVPWEKVKRELKL